MSKTIGWRNWSPSSAAPWTAIATIVARESASCRAFASPPRPLRGPPRPLINSPARDRALERTSAAVPAARLVIQKRCGPAEVAAAGIKTPR